MNKLLNSLKNDKEDRRRVISLWQDSELDTICTSLVVYGVQNGM